MKAWAAVGIGGLERDDDRILGDDVDVGRDLDPARLITSRSHVGLVDDPGIRFAGGHLGHHRPHVLLQRIRRHRHPGRVEDLLGIRAARHLRSTHHRDQIIVLQISNPRDPERIVRSDDDLQQVRREHHRIRTIVAGIGQLRHVVLIRRREHIRRSTLVDLGHQLRRRSKVERHIGIRILDHERITDLGERIRQRRRSKHRDGGRSRVGCRRVRRFIVVTTRSHEPHESEHGYERSLCPTHAVHTSHSLTIESSWAHSIRSA